MTKLGRAIDRIGIAAAVLYALPTLTYPLGRDLALFLYIGHRWVHGALPYRDVYDFKPPGIFVVNALTAAVFGEAQWGVHVVDVGAILLMSWIVTRAVIRDRPARAGELGAVALAIAGFYYTTFDYMEVAQTELWESLAVIGAYAVAIRASRARDAAIAGLLVGAGIVCKPTAILLGVVPAIVLAVRAARAAKGKRGLAIAQTLGAFAGAGACVGIVVVGYWFVCGGLDAMIEMVIRHVWDYHAHAKFREDVTRHWFLTKLDRQPWTFFFVFAWLYAVVSAAYRRAWGPLFGLACTLLFATFALAIVAYQRRFLGYYWVVFTPFAGLAAAHAVAEIRRPAIALAAAAFTIWAGLRLPPVLPRPYLDMTKRFWQYARGNVSRDVYLEPFEEYRSEERLASIIRSRARPGDRLMVRGYEPALYVVSGLTCPSRFAVEIPYTTEGMTYKRDEWFQEHERDVWNARVRFAVTFAPATWDADAIRARGYHEIARSEMQVVFERDD